MSERFADASSSGNNNNFISDRSSTRLSKPPGGCSTVGSLIFGGGDDRHQPSYLDERKSRRFNPHRAGPEHDGSSNNNNVKTPEAGAAEMSYYAKSTAAQELRDRLAVAPGAVSRETLSQQHTTLAVARRGKSSNSSDYFAGGMGGQDGDNQGRRTRRMFAAPGGNSSFKLG